jgi:hypothetical protein
MSKIATYPSADTPLQLSDRLIGTEAIRTPPTSTPLATKNFSLGELLQLFSANFPAASLQAVLNTGNTATQNITLTGTITTTVIKPNNIEDTSGSQGTTFQYLSKGTSSINWVNLPIDTLQAVLNAGNIATQNITLVGNITSTRIIPGNIQDDTGGIGIIGQVLSKTATGIRWITNPSSFTAGLADVLSVGNTATNDITLIGDINASNAKITGAFYDSNNSPGTLGQVLSSKGTQTDWIDIPLPTPAALTEVDDINVTLTLGGSPNTALLQAVSLTLGWTGTLADDRIASAANWNAKFNLPSLTSGSVLFSNGTTIAQDNANFFWDDTNNRLGIGTATPAASSKLDITSTTQGFLPPRMTTTQKNAIVTPATGLVVYDTTLLSEFQYNGTSWISDQPQLNGTGFVKASGTTISYDNSVYAPIIAKDFVNDGVSGTTVNTIIRSYLIPSNTFVLNDSLDILCSVFKNTTLQNVTLRVYFNTTVSLTGATLVGTYALSTTTKFLNFQRTNMYTGSSFYCFPPTASSITDRSITNVDLAVLTFNNLVNNYIIFAIQLSNSLDGGYIGGIRITK